MDVNALVLQVVDLTRARWSDMEQKRGVVIEVNTLVAAALPRIMGADNEIRDGAHQFGFQRGRCHAPRWSTDIANPIGAEQGIRPDRGHRHGYRMDEETRRRCLEPFFTTKGERGTGLGLAMVYGAMQRHGADIEIESAPGVGTIMRLSFAIATRPEVEDTAPASATAVAPRRILVVDDDPLVLKSLRDTLEADGHSVITADGGPKPASMPSLQQNTRDNPFQVVITDLGMPYVDGRKVSSAVKAIAPETVVLMLTGWGQRLVADGEVPPHVDRIFSKPAKLRELREALAAGSSTR